jgi:hypothetical protein
LYWGVEWSSGVASWVRRRHFDDSTIGYDLDVGVQVLDRFVMGGPNGTLGYATPTTAAKQPCQNQHIVAALDRAPRAVS